MDLRFSLKIRIQTQGPSLTTLPHYHNKVFSFHFTPLVACGEKEVVEGGWIQVVFDVLDFVLE